MLDHSYFVKPQNDTDTLGNQRLEGKRPAQGHTGTKQTRTKMPAKGTQAVWLQAPSLVTGFPGKPTPFIHSAHL